MGLEFGRLNRIVGITYYSLSPYEQRALAGVINPGLKNTIRRCRESFFLVVVPIAIIYAVTSTANDIHRKANRKNPQDYINDK